jgi:NADP-dependent 3-hydroxy acid dehydrogenase YdfG
MIRSKTALVTGASGGMGHAIAIALARQGMALILVARDQARLAGVREHCIAAGARMAECVSADFSTESGAVTAADCVGGELDVLVHSAGHYSRDSIEEASVDEFDRLYAANLRAPYRLIQLLLPALKRAGGDVVLMNSTQGLSPTVKNAQFAATQHAMKAIGDVLRAEVNEQGVRVLTVFSGSTATPRQERIFAAEGRCYRPEQLMQPEDVAAAIVAAIALPRTAEMTSMTLRPFRQAR